MIEPINKYGGEREKRKLEVLPGGGISFSLATFTLTAYLMPALPFSCQFHHLSLGLPCSHRDWALSPLSQCLHPPTHYTSCYQVPSCPDGGLPSPVASFVLCRASQVQSLDQQHRCYLRTCQKGSFSALPQTYEPDTQRLRPSDLCLNKHSGSFQSMLAPESPDLHNELKLLVQAFKVMRHQFPIYVFIFIPCCF